VQKQGGYQEPANDEEQTNADITEQITKVKGKLGHELVGRFEENNRKHL
jgi:hypothetical protein